MKSRLATTLFSLCLAACDPSPCDTPLDIPTDCEVDANGDAVEDVCRVDGDDSWTATTHSCGRAEVKYQGSICEQDPAAVTEEVIAAIVCERVE